MKKKYKLLTAALLISMLAGSYGNIGRTQSVGVDNQTVVAETASQTITVGQMADFLSTKKEHYPFSDQFMERYQQTSGGYLGNAKKAGIVVDRLQHSPNQKWHFFTSWYYPSIENGDLGVDEDAKDRIYTRLYCPELLLWIYEACGVAPAKVKKAMDAAVVGKVAGLAVMSIAKNMRACVAWEDLAEAFKVKKPAEGLSLDKTSIAIKAGESEIVTATVSPADTTDSGVWSIVEGEDIISITQTAGQVTVRGLKEGNAKIKVVYNQSVFAEVTVSVARGDTVLPDPTPTAGVYKYNIVYDLGTRTTAKEITSVDEILDTFSLVGGGNGIITSVSKEGYIYGGGNGGRGETKWYTGNMLKFGTTNANGSITLQLSSSVNYIKITGYVYDNACKLTVGDTEFVCSDMNEVSKEIVEGGQTSTALITFASTNSLTISMTNKKPLFIVSIELGYDSALGK